MNNEVDLAGMEETLNHLRTLMQGDRIEPFKLGQGLLVVDWSDHLLMPRDLTEFYPGLYSKVFDDSPDDGVINRIVFLDKECGGIGDQIHTDFREKFTVIEGAIKEVYTGTTLGERDQIVIEPGIKHAFRRISDGDIILDLEITHVPQLT